MICSSLNRFRFMRSVGWILPHRLQFRPVYFSGSRSANFAFQALLLFLFESELGLHVILACKDLRHTSFQFFLPLAHLCWGQLVGLGNLVDHFEALKGFDGDSCFEFRCEVSSLSLHFVCFTWVDHRRRAFEISIATWLHLGLPLHSDEGGFLPSRGIYCSFEQLSIGRTCVVPEN